MSTDATRNSGVDLLETDKHVLYSPAAERCCCTFITLISTAEDSLQAIHGTTRLAQSNTAIESPRPKERRFWGNRRGCVAGRETLGVILPTGHRLSHQQFPGVQPDYALTSF